MSSSTRSAPPVLLLAFNRPEPTRRVLDALRRGGLSRLYVSLDGPREGRPEEAARCAEVHDLVQVGTWAKEIVVRRGARNFGCKDGVTAGLDWFFDQEPEGVVLEDDCLPGDDFLPFCSHVLERYRDDQRVWQVSGTNLLGSWRAGRSDYFFGDGSIWGWASWRRAWQQRDMSMQTWEDPVARDSARRFLGPLGWRALADNYAAVAAGNIDTWDYQWSWTRASSEGLSVIPARNLVTNIGFGPDATHTVRSRWPANLDSAPLPPPLSGPDTVTFDHGYQTVLAARTEGLSTIRSIGSRVLRRTVGRKAWERLRP